MKELAGKVAVVTGGASGIGRKLAECCAADGMKVVLADIEEGALAAAVKEMAALGADVLGVATDVSKADSVAALAAKTLDAHGAVHMLFNNAGVVAGGVIWESSLADWQWLINVNLWGVVHGVHTFVPIMLDQDVECHIANTASMAGLISGAGLGIYKITKHAVVSLSETLYHELTQRQSKIRVSVICPGLVHTNLGAADRNRPPSLVNDPDSTTGPSAQITAELLREYGMPVEQLARRVFDAIKQDKFYILPHTEAKPAIELRLDDVRREGLPTDSNTLSSRIPR